VPATRRLLLTQSEWHNSLNRFAETMTLFAVVCAGIYPVLHLGRPWYLYWMFPYPATMDVWPQFRSPLEWDIWAVLTYLTVSLAFWYTGLIPDLAAARDRATKRGWQIFFGITSLGWRGSAAHWLRWSQAYRLTAGLAVPLVVSVHSEVSLLFAAGQIPGWHSTIFPPYFVLGQLSPVLRWSRSSRFRSAPGSVSAILSPTIISTCLAWFFSRPD